MVFLRFKICKFSKNLLKPSHHQLQFVLMLRTSEQRAKSDPFSFPLTHAARFKDVFYCSLINVCWFVRMNREKTKKEGDGKQKRRMQTPPRKSGKRWTHFFNVSSSAK